LHATKKLIVPFLLPGILIVLVLFIFPAFQTVIVSLQDWYGTFRTTGFVGFKNYLDIATDPLFTQSVLTTFKYFFLSLLLLFPSALFLAVSLTKIKTGRLVIEFLIFAPVVLSVVVASILWKFIYDPNMGLLTPALKAIGLGSIVPIWLGDPSTALVAVTIVTIWHGISTWVILIMSGIDRIPTQFAEAARMEGASGFVVFFRITLPLLWEVLSTLIILWFIQAMQTFPFIYIMTNGGPFGTTEVMGTYMYKVAFVGRMFSYGSAMAIIMALIILVFSLLGSKLIKREVYEF